MIPLIELRQQERRDRRHLDRLFAGDPLPDQAKWFILAVIAAGGVITLYAAYHAAARADSRLIYLVALTVAVSLFPVRIPLVRGEAQSLSITMADILVFFVIFIIGPEGAALVAAAEALTISTRSQVKRIYKRIFNVAQLVIVAFVVARVFYFLHGGGAPLDSSHIGDGSHFLLEAGFSGLLYFAFNSGLVAVAIGLATKQSIVALWVENLLWPCLTHLAGASLSAVVFLYFKQSQLHLAGVAIPMVVLIYYAYKINLKRITDAQRHLEDAHNLLLEKIEAEKALQSAKADLEIRVRQRTAELAAEKDRLDVTLCSIEDGVIATDREGRITLFNAKAARITGRTEAEVAGKSLTEIFDASNKSIADSFAKTLAKVLPRGESVTLEVQNRFLSPDNRERTISHRASPIHDADDGTAGAVLVFTDTTLERKMEEELLRTEKLESLGVLAGGIAHDFNNSLAGILLQTQLAQLACKKREDPRQFLASIEEATRMAAGLARQLLTFAKGDEPIKETVWIKWLIQESVSFALRGSNVRCDIDVSKDLWPVRVDKGQVSQVIHNLVLNALQAMPGGGTITVAAANVEVSQDSELSELSFLPPGRYVEVSVRDEGRGIPAEQVGRIFDPYFTTKPSGSGLGLTTTRSIIKRHGGAITVESTKGKGTTFTFYLPASTGPVQEELQSRDGPQAVRQEGRILVMDDEAVIRDGMKRLLENIGYHVDCTSEGTEAIAAYKEAQDASTPYDAVIMDLTIPGGLGGKEAIQQLLRMDPGAAVIVSSGYSKDPVMANFQSYGFRAMLVKPFTFEELTAALAKTRPGGQNPASAA